MSDDLPNPTEQLPNPALKNTIVPNPTTERGAATVLGAHPKEPKIIYCSGKCVIVRDLEDPTNGFVYRGHNDQTTVAKFSPNGYWVASGDITGKVRVWSYDNPEHTLKTQVPVLNGKILDLCWDPDSKRIVAVGDGRSVMARVFMWDTGNNIGEVVGHQKRILSVDYKPTRPYRIFTASEDFNVCFYEGPPFKFKQNNSGNHNNYVNCVRFSPDGSKAVSVGSDKLICLYDGKTGDLTDKFPSEHTGSIYSVAWSPDGTQFITSSADKTCLLWDAESKSVVKKFTFSDAPQVGDMQVSVIWMKDHIISLSLNGDLNFLDLENPSIPKQVIQSHQVNILSVAAEPEKQTFVTGSYDGVVCSWHGLIGKKVGGNTHKARISSIAVRENQIVSTGWDDVARFANLDELEYNSSDPLNAQPNGVSLCSKDPTLAAVSTNKGVFLLKDQQIVSQTPEFAWTPTCVAISPEGDQVAVGGQEDNKIHLFDVANNTLQESGEIAGHLGSPNCIEYSPDGKYIACGDTYREVRVWDAASRANVVQGHWVFHTTRVASLAWAPSGKYIASGSSDESIYVWTLENVKEKIKFEFTHKGGVTGVDFLNEEELISTGNDGCVRVWEIKH